MALFSLDTLPVEILYRILINGPTSSSLALSRVSRRFRAVCTDPLVYVGIINGNNAFGGDTSDSSWSHSLYPNLQKDWRVCARWSLADEKAEEAMEKWRVKKATSHVNTQMTETTLLSLPELILHGHLPAETLLAQPEGLILSSKFNSDKLSVDLTTRLAFCDAARCTLLQSKHRNLRGPVFSQEDGLGYEVFTVRAPYLRVCYAISAEVLLLGRCADLTPQGPSPNHVENAAENCGSPPPSLQNMILATLISGMLHRALSLALDRHRINMRHRGGPNLYPPSIRDIPLTELYANKLPPFTTAKDDRFQSCFLARHLPMMTSPEFLTDGERIGYYCYNHAGTIPSWDAMMHSVRFEVTADYADHCAFTSRGDDGCCPFSLSGTCHKRSGWVQMTKRYETSLTWIWSAVMTPFGIVGNWRGGRGRSGNGLIWLWKRAWADQGRVSPPAVVSVTTPP